MTTSLGAPTPQTQSLPIWGETNPDAVVHAWFDSLAEVTPDHERWQECARYVGRLLHYAPDQSPDLNEIMGYLSYIGKEVPLSSEAQGGRLRRLASYVMRPRGRRRSENEKLERLHHQGMLWGRQILRVVLHEAGRERHVQWLEELVYRDPRTGLLNERALRPAIEHMILGVDQGHYEGFAVGIFDLDAFKLTNDTFGHKKGDELLAEVAKFLLRTTRKPSFRGDSGDIIMRLGGEDDEPEGEDRVEGAAIRKGGDEFVVVLPRVKRPLHPSRGDADSLEETYKSSATKVATRLQGGITDLLLELTEDKIPGIGVSFGVAFWEPGMTVDEVMDRVLHLADQRMYVQKAERKFTPGENTTATE